MTLEQKVKDVQTLLSILTNGWDDKNLFMDDVPILENGKYEYRENKEYTLHYGWIGVINNLAQLLGLESLCKEIESTISLSTIDKLMAEAHEFIDIVSSETKSGL